MFVVNPLAGNGKSETITPLIKSYFSRHSVEPIINLSQYAGHATVICKELIKKKPSAIIAVGGDGTVNEVVNGIGLSGVPMGIIPHGSGNGFARHLGIPTHLEKALALIKAGYSIPVDLIRIGERYSINVSGVGFDALVAWKFQKERKRGLSSYLKITAKEFLTYQPKKYELTVDGKKSECEAFMISIANSSQFGNNILIAPQASVCDGLLDLCIIKPFPKLFILNMIYWLLKKRIDHNRYVKIIKAKKISIEQQQNIYHLDGEALEGHSMIQAEVVEKSFRVIIPARQKHLI